MNQEERESMMRRRFLIPKKMAMEATKNAINERNQKIAKENRLREEEKAAALEMKKKLNNSTVNVPVKCNGDKMYGSVTNQDVADALAAEGFVVDKKKITLPGQIKSLGVYDAEVWCYKETIAKIKINVIAAK